MPAPTAVRGTLATGLLAIAAVTLAGCASDPPSAVVGLTVTGCPPGTANGTGVVVEPGLILTSAHVVKGADEITVTNGDHRTTAEIVAFDPDMDLAYLRVATPLAPLPLTERRMEAGTPGTAYVYRDGEVVAVPVVISRAIQIHTEDIYVEGDTYRRGFELEADIRAGDSGGPVMVGGEVVGVVWARSSKFDGRAYAIDPVGSGTLVREQLRSGRIGEAIDLTRCN
jgi:serine protease Do